MHYFCPLLCIRLLLTSLYIAHGEVTVLRSLQYIYDKSPRLKIRGVGFEGVDFRLDIGASGSPLIANHDYVLSKDPDSDGVILKLLYNRHWVDLSSRVPPVAIILNSVRFGDSESSPNLLYEPVIVASVLNTPTVEEGSVVITDSGPNDLFINGTGLIGAKKIDLYFEPELQKGIVYDDITKYPLFSNQIQLRLKGGYNWRDDDGPVKVMGIDTGAGPVMLNGHEGIKIAEVPKEVGYGNVVVYDTAQTQVIYEDEEEVVISGRGFSTLHNILRFADDNLKGNGVNYTMVSTNETSVTLMLNSHSVWHRDTHKLPAPLTLTAINVGDGFLNVGTAESQYKVHIATVYERPKIHVNTDLNPIYNDQKELHIKGTGFHNKENKYGLLIRLRFAPQFSTSDYLLEVMNSTNIIIQLKSHAKWPSENGILSVIGINTRGDETNEAGWVKFGKTGVEVAKVAE